MTRALDPAVVSILCQTIHRLLPHPTIRTDSAATINADLVCVRGIPIRLVTCSSWKDIEAIMNLVVSDNTLWARRDKWIAPGVFDQLEAVARVGYDRTIGLDLRHVAIDGSIHKRLRLAVAIGCFAAVGRVHVLRVDEDTDATSIATWSRPKHHRATS